MNDRLKRLTDDAIKFIQNAEKLALRMDERGFHVLSPAARIHKYYLPLWKCPGVNIMQKCKLLPWIRQISCGLCGNITHK